jgi:hypothetical protein
MVSCALRQPAGHVENDLYVRAATLNRVSENRTGGSARSPWLSWSLSVLSTAGVIDPALTAL